MCINKKTIKNNKKEKQQKKTFSKRNGRGTPIKNLQKIYIPLFLLEIYEKKGIG